MKITLLKDMAISGKHCVNGSIAEVSDRDGSYLINGGHAKEFIEKKVTKKAK